MPTRLGPLRGETTHDPRFGVPGYRQRLPRPRRIGAVLAMFVYSAFVILVGVKPFAKGLETLGQRFALQFLPFFQDFEGLMAFSVVYLLLGAALLVRRRRDLRTVLARAREHGRRGAGEEPHAEPSAGE